VTTADAVSIDEHHDTKRLRRVREPEARSMAAQLLANG
jgi:hypothetical protein